jgi:hypothetical protein
MALDTVKGFINSYKPQNAFSFEICKRNKRTGEPDIDPLSPVEIYLTVGPQQYSESFKFRISHEPTFNEGTSVVDMGRGNSQIKLDGELHIYHYDVPRSSPPVSGDLAGDSFVDFGTNLAKASYEAVKNRIIDKYQKIGGIGVRSGVEEFFDLMGLLYYARFDKNIYKPKQGSQGEKLLKQIASNKFNYSDYCLIFHDYDRGRHVEVIIPAEGFIVSRSTKDTNTYQYSINLVVIKDLEKQLKVLAPKTGQSPFFALNVAISDLQSLINYPLKLSGLLVNVAQFVKQVTGVGGTLVQTFNNMKNRFNADGKLISSTFQSAVDDINRARGRKKNSTYLEIVESALQETQDLLYESSNDESVFGSLTANAIAATQSLLYMTGLILNPPNTTGNPAEESLLPDADSTNLIDNELYQWGVAFHDTLLTIQSNYLQSSIDDSFRIYYGSNSDTFDSVSQSVLGDITLAGAVASYNNMDINANLAGQVIRLPFGPKSNIFYKLPENYTRKDLEYGIFGFDLALTSQRDFAISPNGDLAVTEGLNTLIENIVDIIDIPIGSWVIDRFIGNPILIGEVQAEQDKQNTLAKLLQQLESDVRIDSTSLLEATQEGGSISYLIRIVPVAGTEFFLRV